MSGLFGFSINSSTQKPKKQISPVAQSNEDGSDYYIVVVFMDNM